MCGWRVFPQQLLVCNSYVSAFRKRQRSQSHSADTRETQPKRKKAKSSTGRKLASRKDKKSKVNGDRSKKFVSGKKSKKEDAKSKGTKGAAVEKKGKGEKCVGCCRPRACLRERVINACTR